MFNFCSNRRSFQWCPDQSDRPTGAWDMHKNAQKVKRKTQIKICCHYTGLLHGESCPSRWRFPRSFLTASKPSRRSITAAKRKEKVRKEKPKKNVKNRKSQNFDFCACPRQNVAHCDASGEKAKLLWCKGIFDRIAGNLTEIEPRKHQNVQETPFFAKSSGVQWVKWWT